MKRRVISIITTLALCLGLCPVESMAAGWDLDTGLCPHHQVHTEECGYVSAVSGQECTHEHDENCTIAEILCVHQHAGDCYPDFDDDSEVAGPSLCAHECSEESGCITRTLNCFHVHDEFCGFVPGDTGAPCMFTCRVCPIEELMDKLPRTVTPDNKDQVEAQLAEILALYVELTSEEQELLDLSRCMDLQEQLDAANVPELLDEDVYIYKFDVKEDTKVKEAFVLKRPHYQFSTCGYTYTATEDCVIRVPEGTKLYLPSNGKLVSEKAAGVEIQKDGRLEVGNDNTDMEVIGETYGLEILAGAGEIMLSGGTFTGKLGAIQVAGDNYAALLKKDEGYAFFDENGNGINASNTNKLKAEKTLVVKKCTEHIYDQTLYEPISGTTTHSWVCAICGVKSDNAKAEPCTFTFDETRTGTCVNCGNKIVISITQSSVYNGTPQPKDNDITVTLGDSNTQLEKGTDYTAEYEPRTNVGEVTVTVTGITYNGSFTGTYEITQDKPEITWDNTTCSVPYDGSPVESSDLPNISIDVRATNDNELRPYIQYFYRIENNGADFTSGLPTNAGTYEIKASIPEQPNYEAAVTAAPLKLTIAPKSITPTIVVSETSYVYDGSKKNPVITVRDGQTVIEDDQYDVNWVKDGDSNVTELRSVGTYTATIKTKTNANYSFNTTATVEIIAATQDALSITGTPTHVYYGDTITTLSTVGGTGNGTVTWSITPSGTGTTITTLGELTVKDTGTYTVTAERAVDNHESVSATWTFTVEKKPVMAVVNGVSKVYDGDNTVTGITANVKASDLVESDGPITISGLKGTFDDANVGTNKTVTLDSSGASIGGSDASKYNVSYPATTTGSITARPVTVTVKVSETGMETDPNDSSKKYFVYDGKAKEPAVTVKYTENSSDVTIDSSNYTVSYSNNINASTDSNPATVTVTAKAGGNYTFTTVTPATFEIKAVAAELTSTPQALDLTYNGNPQDLVTVGTASGGKVVYCSTKEGTYTQKIPQGITAGMYTVYYKIEADSNHTGTEPSEVSVTIKPKTITAAITLSQGTYTYDGNECKPTVTVKDGGDTIGTDEYTVSYRDNINAGTATVVVSDNNGGNYIVNGTATFTIDKAAPTVNAPAGMMNLPYNGTAQELITQGSSPDGTMVYSLNSNGPFSGAIPTGTAVKDDYKVYYKVLGDSNHNDSTPASVDASIIKNEVNNPTITLSSGTFRYNGSEQRPTITVRDDKGFLIAENEYVVKITVKKEDGTKVEKNPVDVGEYIITITAAANSNYEFKDDDSRTPTTFKIVEADQEVLSITNTRGQVYYGDIIQLGTLGGTGNGTVTWKVEDGDGNPLSGWISDGGLLTVKDVGGNIKVTAERTSPNYNKTTAEWVFYAHEKPVTAVLTGVDREYKDNDKSVKVEAEVKASDLVFKDTITITGLTGTFKNADVGTNKTVDVDSSKAKVAEEAIAKRYAITYPATTTASITPAEAKVATIPKSKDPNPIYDGTPKELVTAGTTLDGTMVYSLDGTNFSLNIPTATNAGTYTVYYKVQGDSNHTDSPVTSVQATIDPKTVTAPTIALNPPEAIYDGTMKQPTVTVRDNVTYQLIPRREYQVTYDTTNGENWKDAASNYKVIITNVAGGNYDVSGTKSFEIKKATPAIATNAYPTASPITSGQPLSSSILSGGVASVAGTFAWENEVPDPVSGYYDVRFTPDSNNINNYNTVIIQVHVTVTEPDPTPGPDDTPVFFPPSSTPSSSRPSTASQPSTPSAPTADEVPNDTAATILDSAEGDRLVDEAVTNESEEVVIKPEISEDANKAEVSIPASTVGRLSEETSANLVVSTPVADVTIPNAALGMLSNAGGPVNVMTERTNNTLTLTLTADGETVESIPGGVTLAVPVENAGPGTVAVLVHEDGTRETLRKSVAGDGVLNIPLNGSATVEIVDNSKEFTDVPPESWAADAVAFASAHELFNGTSEDTFSPEQPMSRGMLATVLYNLEGRPAQETASVFSDVDGDAWYADGVSWATANGITNGYGDGQFGPDDSISREQFAVMLWKYAGSPAASNEVLGFTDEDKISAYAREALRWAIAKGVMSGLGNGQLDPNGLATRAQAAQMLKNFLENI